MGKIQIVKGNILDSKANFIVNPMSCQDEMNHGISLQIAQLYPHVEKEYLKYTRHCKKSHIDPLGTVQYIPCEFWAVGMVDTMKNEDVVQFDGDSSQYIVNMFGQDNTGNNIQTDLMSVKRAFENIKDKAEKINASVALPYNICCCGLTTWNYVYTLIKMVFENSKVNVEIWK